jgi:hypothetical protein
LFKMERRKYGLFTNVNDRILDWEYYIGFL